jgi:DNA-binding Lrp family transcriptional regulator
LKDVELKLLSELIKNSRKSDRELAKSIGVSQPTASRIRTRLEKEGVIEYSGVPDLGKLGFEIIAITFGNWKHERYPDTKAPEAQDFIEKHPNIIFVSTGRGLGSDRVAVSVHKSYSDYTEYMQEVKADWAEFMTITGSFLISLGTDNVLRPISFRYLADFFGKEKSK